MNLRNVAAFASGLVMATGLCLSEMTDPGRVLGFLDFFGRWDPTLAFVMMGAIGSYAVLYRLILRRSTPLLEARFSIPSGRAIDLPLLLGSALFGLGWGLSGYCPGPAITSLGRGSWQPLLFTVGVSAGMLGYGLWRRRPPAIMKRGAW